jgi:S1-C subfamily serine protease
MVSVLGFVLATSLGSFADYALPVVSNDPASKHIKGTAFLLAPDQALTAAHVVDTFGAAAAVRCGTTRIAGVVVKFSSKYDLAVIQLEWPCRKVPVSKLASEEPGEGARIFAVGYPGGMGRMLTSGAISALDFYDLMSAGAMRWVMLFDLKIFGGNSGGPVLDNKGRVVGLVTGRVCLSSRGQDAPECYGIATPVSSIHLFLNRD